MRVLFCLACFLLALPVGAVGHKMTDGDPYVKEYQKDYAAAYAFQKALAAGDKQAVAQMVFYPLELPLPLKPIENASELVKHWDWFFAEKDIAFLTKPEKVGHIGWRGVTIGSGSVWFYGEKVTAIQTRTPALKNALAKAKKAEQARFHPSVGVYETIGKVCETGTKKVRIHTIKTAQGEEERLILWDKKAKLSDKPLEIIDHAEYENMGTAHNEHWAFEKNGLTYELETLNVCGYDCTEYLLIRRGDEEISKEVCLTEKRR